ncbi:MAG: diaminopimelate decarboxylase [Candidatus Thermoplasmatota archaeon]|jgi:diaminopimelate decarboxylase|nr:diaminopimelate decarboxylase [Candidatus Thermoplasmatota archaeon]MCL5680463.1 diaminopimelate decarboxylase [Candidatus Thermoplasmatota archaeon]
MDFLSYFDVEHNTLYMDGKKVIEIAERYGTPLILYSKKRILENITAIRNAFQSSSHSIHFAVKSNFNPFILSLMKENGVGADVSNYNEAILALRAGIKPDDIIASPNNMTREELLKIINLGIAVNFDDVSQMDLVKDHLPHTVSFRINPGIGKGEFTGITTGGKGSKFGIPVSSALSAYRKAKNSGARRFGIHMMAGSNILDPSFFKASTGIFFEVADKISSEGDVEFEFLDVGGGFGVPYRDSDERLDLNTVAANIMENFNKYQINGMFKGSKLILEPGRFLVADAGVLLAKVTNIKKYDKLIIGTDVSMNTLIRSPLYGATHPVLVVDKVGEKPVVNADIVGQVCENTDVLRKDVMLPKLEYGDLLAFLNAGAYVTSMASNYNMIPRPKEIMLDGNDEIMLRREDTLDDMLSQFIFP